MDNGNIQKKDNELAIVHEANRHKLDKLKKNVKDTKDDIKKLITDVDELLGNDTTVILTQQKTNFRSTFNAPNSSLNWKEIVKASTEEIKASGLDPEQLSSYDLLSPAELSLIQQKLNRPLYERIPWDKWDYRFAFGAGLVGGGLDIFLGTPGFGLQAQMADKDSWIGSIFENIHKKHPLGDPIDYTGKNFGGIYHRGLSSGHDLLRPLEGIRQFKDGLFRGYYWANGEKILFESFTTPGGVPFKPRELWGASILAWSLHMICDFFSTTSLPIPGTSYFREINNRDLRIFVQKDLYEHGINLRHLVLQTVAPFFIEVFIRSYIYFRYHKQTLDPDALLQKKLELLTVGHSISTGFNIGKIIIMQDPTMLNMPQLIALSKTLIQLVLKEYKRNSFSKKVLRNLGDLRKTRQEYEALVNNNLPTAIVLQ